MIIMYIKVLKDEKLNFIELENKLTKKKQKIKILKEKIRGKFYFK